MHAQHTHVEGVVGGQCAQSHDGPGGGYTAFFHELPEFFFRLAEDNALSEENEGALGLVDEPGGFFDMFLAYDGFWSVTSDVVTLRVAFVIEFLYLRILGDVDEDGTGAAAAGDIECLGQDGGYFRRIGHLVVPFGNGRGDIDHVSFLEGVGAQQVCEDLAGDANQGGAVDHGVSQSGDEVCRAGAAGGEHDTCFAG